MTIRSDYSLLNNCSTDGDWTTGGNNAPDSPKLNNSSSTVPYYIEGTSCMDFPLKSNADGYTYDGVANLDFTNRLTVWWHWFPGPDVDGLPLNTMRLRFSDAAGFTTDYDEWNVIPYLEAAPGSFVAMKVWPTNPTASNGTPDNANVSSYGMVVATGGTDNKAAAFDHIFQISELGGHSATYTETLFDLMYTGEAESNVEKVIDIWVQASDFYQSSVSIALGNDVAANTIVTETSKTVFFDNVEPEQELSYIFYGGSTGQVSLTLNSVGHFWNSQLTTHDIFRQISEVDVFKLTACSFANGGAVELPAHSGTDRFTRNCTFASCGEIDVGDHDFTGNTVDGADDAVLYTLANDRAANNSYTNCVDAVRVVGAGVDASIDIDGDQFSGNTYDIIWDSSAGVLTVNALNGANPAQAKTRTTGTGSVSVVNAVNIEVTVLDDSTGSPIQNARVQLYLTSDYSTEVLSDGTDVNGEVSASYNYGGSPVNIEGWARQMDVVGTDYVPKNISGTIGPSGFSITVRLLPL